MPYSETGPTGGKEEDSKTEQAEQKHTTAMKVGGEQWAWNKT